MNTTSPIRTSARRSFAAFSLIELMVVISIIGILAALIFPIAAAAKKAQMRSRAKVEMVAIETALAEYQTKKGFYPPDNAPNWAANQLYFELFGTTNIVSTNTVVYQTLDGSAQMKATDLAAAIGPNVTGFMNCSKGGEDGVPALNFAKNLKAAQFLAVTNNSGTPVTMALGMPGSTLPGPTLLHSPIGGTTFNPWCYNSSSPRYNPKTFDLWIDIIIANQTNRICNWSDRPLIVSTPY